MNPRLGQALLVLSGLGFPLTQAVIRRFGVGGAAIVETISAGFLVRDVALLATGAPRRLRRGPVVLLWIETGAAAAATALGLLLVVSKRVRGQALEPRPAGTEALRRLAVGGLCGLHTLRFRIYLRPDHGLLGEASAEPAAR